MACAPDDSTSSVHLCRNVHDHWSGGSVGGNWPTRSRKTWLVFFVYCAAEDRFGQSQKFECSASFDNSTKTQTQVFNCNNNTIERSIKRVPLMIITSGKLDDDYVVEANWRMTEKDCQWCAWYLHWSGENLKKTCNAPAVHSSTKKSLRNHWPSQPVRRRRIIGSVSSSAVGKHRNKSSLNKRKVSGSYS